MADPKQTRLSPADRRARDRLMREEHEQGATLEALAQRFGVSVATVKRAISRARTLSAEEQLADVDPVHDLLTILDALRQALATCVTEMRNGDNSAARVGAAKATVSVGAALRDTLASAGHLPGRIVNPTSSGEHVRYALETQKITDAYLDVADRHGLDWEEIERELDRELEEALS
jgi:AraC-like DNA-binding protein